MLLKRATGAEMKFKKAYNIVKIITTSFMALFFIIIDIMVLHFQDYILYLLFIPLELMFVLIWILILKFNKTMVFRINTGKGRIDIFTYGEDYTVNARDITVKPGNFFCYLSFNGVRLRANSSSKSVAAFLHKYQNIYKKVKK